MTLTLSPRGAVDGQVYVDAGQWQLIGDPSQVPASVAGADVVEAYDPGTGSYSAVSVLQPGQGAWAYSAAGGRIALTPVQP